MGFIEDIKAKAKAEPKRIVLPEGDEPRTVRAAAAIRDQGIAIPKIGRASCRERV